MDGGSGIDLLIHLFSRNQVSTVTKMLDFSLKGILLCKVIRAYLHFTAFEVFCFCATLVANFNQLKILLLVLFNSTTLNGKEETLGPSGKKYNDKHTRQ